MSEKKGLTFEELQSTAKNTRKTLEQKSLILYNVVRSFENEGKVVFPSGIVAHRLDLVMLVDDLEDMVSFGLVLQQQELLRKRIVSLYHTADHLSHEDERNSVAHILKDFFEAQTEEGVFGGLFLKEGSLGSKEPFAVTEKFHQKEKDKQ